MVDACNMLQTKCIEVLKVYRQLCGQAAGNNVPPRPAARARAEGRPAAPAAAPAPTADPRSLPHGPARRAGRAVPRGAGR